MRVVIQRVSRASVTIGGHCKSSIGKGMMILVGIEEADGQEDIDWLCKKIVNLRIFDDENGVMNKSVLEDGGEILVVSQTRNISSALRTILQRFEQYIRQRNRYRNLRSRHEGRTFERWSCYYTYRYEK